MSTESDLRRELDETYRQFDAADQAGDATARKELQDYGLSLESRINDLRRASNQPALAGTETAPELADPPEVQQQNLDEARPALEEIDSAAKGIDKADDIELSDYRKGAYSDLLRVGAGAFEDWAIDSRLQQQDALDQYESLMGENADPAELAGLKAKVEAGGEIDSTVYGTFIKPFFTKDGVPPEQRLRKAQEAVLKSRSLTAQEKSKKPFFRDDPESLRKFDMAKPSTWFDETSMPWEDPEAFMLALSQNSVSLAASIVMARLGGRAGAMAKGRQLRNLGVSSPTLVRQQAAKAGAATGTVAGSATEYVLVRDATQSGLQDALKEHWGKDELWAENSRYNELTEAGYSPEYAKQVVTDEISRTGGQVAGVSSALLGAPMNRFWAKVGLDKAASRAGSAVKGAVGESLQEGVQETVETLTANIAESTLDPSKPWGADLANAFFGGVAMGGAMGGTMGALSGGDSQVALNKDQKQLNKVGFKEWRDTQNERSSLQSKLRDPEYMQTTSPEQRIRDFNELEELEYREAKAYKRSEKKIRQMQKKYGVKANEKRRTEIFSDRYAKTIQTIDAARQARIGAEEQVESTRQQMAERDEIIRRATEDNVELADLEVTKADLETVAEGGMVEDADSLIQQGYARWTSKAQTKLVLTPSGRNARRAIGDAVTRLSAKIDSGYAGDERREAEGAGAERRKRLEEMSPEEKDAELKTHEKTNIPNLRAFEEDERDGPAGGYASIDADSLGWVNDNMGGHPKGDELLRKIARAGVTEGIDFYHVTGDEFIARGESEEQVEEGLKRVAARLAGYEPVSDEAGRTVQPAITWTTGDTYENADAKLNDMKAQRALEGKRAPKKDAPPPSLFDPNAPTQFGLFSYNGPVSAVQDIVNQIKKVRGNTDEFSQRRVRKLNQQMADLKERTESADIARAVEGLMDEVQFTPTNAELAREWDQLDATAQQRYELAAVEFYTPYAGEQITALEVYQHEHGSSVLAEKLPSSNTNDAGDRVLYENSQEFAQIREFANQGNVPQELRRSLQRDAQRLGELMQNEDDGLAYALSMRVASYLGGEYAARGPSPFSSRAAEFDQIHEDYNRSVLPLLMVAGDPVMNQGFYNPLRKGDRVEVIVNGEGVEGIVSSTGNDSMVVRWDSNGPQLYDPDTGAAGNTARFSTKYGWQSSAKAARAGKPYKSQGLSWPGQARLGRRFNRQRKKWEDAKQSDKALRQIRKGIRPGAPLSTAIARASTNKATTGQLNTARRVAGQLLRGYGNLPTINIANTVAELPGHMQEKLVAHGYSGEGVMGMFDELDPSNGVWVLAGNIAAKAKAEGVPFETLMAEAIAHETIGHYGLRGFMGDEARMDRWMDTLARSNAKIGEGGTVREAVMQTGIQRGLVAWGPKGKAIYKSEEARRLAAEETIAEIAQRVIQQTPGYQLTEQRRGILQRIADHIRVWLIDHGFGRFVRLGDQDIYRMIWHSQNFASNGRGWEFKARTGKTLTPYMRDMDIFRAEILNHFYDGTRKTNGAERKQMVKDGLAPLDNVPFYPKQAGREQWKQSFKKAISDKHIKASEYAMTEMDDFLDNLNYGDLYVDAGIEALPEKMQERVRELDAIVNFDGAKQTQMLEALDKQYRNAMDLKKSFGPSFMGMDLGSVVEDYRGKYAEKTFDFPSDEAVQAAQDELGDILKATLGKKAKIPYGVVMKQLERKAVKVLVKPAGPYQTNQTDSEVHITPENWKDLRPLNPGSYSEYVPIGTNRDTFGVYVFYQQNPYYGSQIDHASFNIDEGYTGSFMHLRYARGELVDGTITYEIVELQSDNFQKKDKAATTNAEREALMVKRDRAMRSLQNAVKSLNQMYGASMKAKITEAYTEFGAWDGTQDFDEYKADLRRHLRETVYDKARNEITNFRAIVQTELNDIGAITWDDARVMEYLDLKALDGAAEFVLNKVANLEEYLYNPSDADKYYTQSWTSRVDSFNQNDTSDAMERVVARPALLKRFANGVLTSVTDQLYLEDEIAPLQKKLQGDLKKHRVVVSDELLDELKTKLGDRILWDALENFDIQLKALGWDYRLFSTDAISGGFSLEAWGSSETPLALAIRAALHSTVTKRSAREWERTERTRINDVQREINRIERPAGEITNDEDRYAALSEISYGEDNNYDPEVPYINDDDYADQKSENEISRARENGRLRELADDYGVDYDSFEYDGADLDRDHPEYRRLISIDEDGDANTEEAEEWLADRISDEIDDLFDSGSAGYDRIHEYYVGEFDNRYGEDTQVRTFAIPIAWDEDGDVTDTTKGYIAWNQGGQDGDIDYLVDDRYEIYFDEEYDSEYNEHDATSNLFSSIFTYYENEEITPPEGSMFRVKTSNDVPQSLRDQLQPLPKPNTGELARLVQEAEMSSEIQSTAQGSLDKAFNDQIMVQRALDQGTTEATPLKDVWQPLALKFAIADAIRKGAGSITWQGGDATTSRGGVGAEWTEVSELSYQKTTMSISGASKEVFVISAPGEVDLVMEPERMSVVLGPRVTKEIMRQASDPDPEAPARRIRQRYTIVPLGERFAVFDNETETVMGFKETALTAETARADLIKSALENAPEGVVSGKITANDMGGKINVLRQEQMSGYYQHTVVPSQRIRGARTSYDVMIPSHMKKLVKAYGGRVEESVKVIDPSLVREAIVKDGAQTSYKVNEAFQNEFPNLRIEAFGSHGYVVLSDNGIARDGTIFKTRGEATEALEDMMQFAQAEVDGIYVYEVKITDEMRVAFGGGNIPILSADLPPGGQYDLNYTKYHMGRDLTKFLEDHPNTSIHDIHEAMDAGATVSVGTMRDWMHTGREVARIKADIQLFGYVKDASANAVRNAISRLDPDWKQRSAPTSQLPMLSKDPISGNPILEAMAKKVGQVPLQKTMAQRFDHFRKGLAARVNQGVFDKFYGIKYAMKQTNWQGTAEQDPYMSARLTTSLDSQMRAVMNYGHPVWDEGIMKVEGKGLLQILAPVGKPEDLRAWSLYMVARRSKRLKEEGREQLITDEEIAEGILLGERYPIFKTVADEYAEFNKAVLDFAEESGVIDPETRPLWEHADYVPFYRVMDERVAGPLSTSTGIANQRKPIKQLKGGEAALSDIPTNIIQNVTNLIESSNKNQAALLAVNALNNTGVMSKIPPLKAEQALVPMSQVKQALVTAGLDPDQIPPSALKGMQKMFVMKPPSGEGVITVLRNGKREYYQTDDRVLWEAMTMINQKQFGRWMSLFRGPKRFLTAAVTLDPGFMLANYVRDLASSFVQSRDTNNPLTHMARSAQGWKQAVMKDESIKTMMSAGSAFDSGYMNYGDPNSTSRAIRKAQRTQGFKRSLLDTPAKIFDYYKEFGASFENANRIAVYNEALANGKSTKQAAFEAKDLMDFSMGGSYPVVQFLIQSVPFMGARLQGLHRLGRGFADNPVAFTMKGLMLTMAGMALWFNYKDDERYKKLEEWDKDTYYHWWIGDEHFRLPKPFEVGVIFNTWLERAFEYAYSEEADAGKLLMERFAFSLSETFAMNPIPQIAKPAFESAFNHNFFTGRQIVDPYTEKRMSPEEFRPSTSPTMVEIARRLPSGLDKASDTFRSPLHLENLYRGYMGTLGRYAMMASDELMREALDYPSKPSMQPADYPVSGRFYRGTDDMPRRTKYEETFYDLVRKTEEVQGSLKFLDKVGNEGRMDLIELEHEPIIALSKDVDNTRKEITKLNKEMFEVWMDETMTPDQKRIEVDEIQDAKNEEYKAIHDLKQEVLSEPQKVTLEDINFMLDKYGVDEVVSRVEKSSPTTASLMRDIQQLEGQELGALAR